MINDDPNKKQQPNLKRKSQCNCPTLRIHVGLWN